MPSRDSKRVLHIMSSYGGGISTFIQNLASEIQQFGVVFDVVCLNECPDNFVQDIQRTGGDVYIIKNPKKAGWRAFRQSFGRVLKLYQYDVIHCHISGYRSLVYRLMTKSFSKAKFIIHAHHFVNDRRLNLPRRILHYFEQQINQLISAKYVGCSRQAVQSIFGYNIDKESIIIVPNSIPVQDFLYDESEWKKLRKEGRQKYQLAEEDIVIGQIGRLTLIKNHRLTLQLAKLAQDQGLNLKFLLVGQGELFHNIKASIKQNQLENYVQLVGRIPDISTFYPIIDCLIFPSFDEGLGTVAIESQSAGVPVVMSQNIPYEVELGLDLITRVAIESPLSCWLDAINKAVNKVQPTTKERLLAVKEHCYTNQQAARIYAWHVADQTIYLGE